MEECDRFIYNGRICEILLMDDGRKSAHCSYELGVHLDFQYNSKVFKLMTTMFTPTAGSLAIYRGTLVGVLMIKGKDALLTTGSKVRLSTLKRIVT